MNADLSRDTDLMLRAVDSVHGAKDLDEALQGLVKVLQARFDLWHAGFAYVATGSQTLKVLAAWSMVDSVFVEGQEVATTILPAVSQIVEDLRAGDVAMAVIGPSDHSLLDHLMREQGVASTLAVPVHQDDNGLLILSFGSSTVGPLHDIGARFFYGLAAGIHERICKLTSSQASS